MGNCCVIRRSKSPSDLWEEEDVEDYYNEEDHEIATSSSSAAEAAAADQVKIKVTKKQLQMMLSKMDQGQGLSVEQVLLQLMKLNNGDKNYQQQEQPWRPSLQSIPEVN